MKHTLLIFFSLLCIEKDKLSDVLILTWSSISTYPFVEVRQSENLIMKKINNFRFISIYNVFLRTSQGEADQWIQHSDHVVLLLLFEQWRKIPVKNNKHGIDVWNWEISYEILFLHKLSRLCWQRQDSISNWTILIQVFFRKTIHHHSWPWKIVDNINLWNQKKGSEI